MIRIATSLTAACRVLTAASTQARRMVLRAVAEVVRVRALKVEAGRAVEVPVDPANKAAPAGQVEVGLQSVVKVVSPPKPVALRMDHKPDKAGPRHRKQARVERRPLGRVDRRNRCR